MVFTWDVSKKYLNFGAKALKLFLCRPGFAGWWWQEQRKGESYVCYADSPEKETQRSAVLKHWLALKNSYV